MNRIAYRLAAFTVVTVLLGLFIYGCAATGPDDQEGGITGTGNAINCDDEKNRKHKLCRSQ